MKVPTTIAISALLLATTVPQPADAFGESLWNAGAAVTGFGANAFRGAQNWLGFGPRPPPQQNPSNLQLVPLNQNSPPMGLNPSLSQSQLLSQPLIPQMNTQMNPQLSPQLSSQFIPQTNIGPTGSNIQSEIFVEPIGELPPTQIQLTRFQLFLQKIGQIKIWFMAKWTSIRSLRPKRKVDCDASSKEAINAVMVLEYVLVNIRKLNTQLFSCAKHEVSKIQQYHAALTEQFRQLEIALKNAATSNGKSMGEWKKWRDEKIKAYHQEYQVLKTQVASSMDLHNVSPLIPSGKGMMDRVRGFFCWCATEDF